MKWIWDYRYHNNRGALRHTIRVMDNDDGMEKELTVKMSHREVGHLLTDLTNSNQIKSVVTERK